MNSLNIGKTKSGKPLKSGVCIRCGSDFLSRRPGKYCSHKCTQPPIEERFWGKVRKAEDPDGCWIWIGCLRNDRGCLNYNGKIEYAYRVSWILHKGPIPEGIEVCHNCPTGDNGRCVNPDHLFLGTHLENVADMRIKGRGSKPPTHYGEEHPLVKVKNEQVAEARKLWVMGNYQQRDLARKFGVSQSTIWRWVHDIYRADIQTQMEAADLDLC